jgi:hypothetical protein
MAFLEKRFACLLLAFLSFTTVLHAQTLQFNNYTTNEGLITDEVYNLYQDRKGYVWVFSKFGTVKYDGKEFKQVLKNLPFKDSFIFSIYENKNGKKWVANSNARIYEIRNDSAFIIPGIEDISLELKNFVSEIQKLYVDDSLNIYAITKGKSYKIVKRGNRYIPYDLSKEIETDSLRVRMLDMGTDLIYVVDHFKDYEFVYGIGSSKKRKLVDVKLEHRGKSYKIPFEEYISPRHFKKFGEDIYFTTGKNIGKISNNKGPYFIDFETVVTNFIKDRNGHLWVATVNRGLYEFNERDSLVNRYLKNTTVNDVLVDAQSGLWVSTPGLGLFRCENLKSWHYKDDEQLGAPISFIKKIEDRLFVGCTTGSLFMFRNGQPTQIRKADNNEPLNMTKYNDGYLVTLVFIVETIGLGKKIQIKGSREVVEKQYHVFSKNKDTAIFIWRRGISFTVKGEFVKRIDFGQKIMAGELIGDVLWLGTEDGAFPYKPVLTGRILNKDGLAIPVNETLTAPTWVASLKNHPVWKIVNDNRGNIWFCTEDEGLFKLRDTLLTNYDASTGLPSNIAKSISFSETDDALLSTNNGLFLSKPNITDGNYMNWKKIYEGEIDNAIFFENKIYVDSKSKLLVLDYKPDDTFDKRFFFNLAAVLVNTQEINPEAFEKVPDSKSSVEFKFDIIASGKSKPPIRYMLHGPVNDSGLVFDATIKFDRLKPGTYSLGSFLLTKQGDQLPIIVSFYVVPAFWETTLFYILVIAVLITIIYLAVRLYVHYAQRKAEIRHKNEQMIAEYKLIALKAQVNPHFMSNCLAAIQQLVRDNKSDRATFYIARFGLLVRKILEYSSKQEITLGEELELLEIYLELEQLRFETKFIYRIEIAESISKKNISVPPLLLNPIIENAVWHGLLPVQNQRQGRLSIQIADENELLIISVEDNGSGRNKKEVTDEELTTSYGIGLTQQRLNSLNSRYKTEVAKMVYEDLVNQQGKPGGTRVTICLPLIFIYDELE